MMSSKRTADYTSRNSMDYERQLQFTEHTSSDWDRGWPVYNLGYSGTSGMGDGDLRSTPASWTLNGRHAERPRGIGATSTDAQNVWTNVRPHAPTCDGPVALSSPSPYHQQ